MQLITITTDNGPRRVEAEVIGPFALIDNDDEINITHLFTGLFVAFAQPADALLMLADLDEAADWYAIGWQDIPGPAFTAARRAAKAVLARY